MKGDGYYDENSKEQRAAMDAFLPWLESSIMDMVIPSGLAAEFGIMDVGSSEGANAIYAMQHLIAAVRNRSARVPVRVVFDDLPTNDFNRLFRNLFSDGRLTLTGEGVYPFAVAGSAFGRLVPSQSLHIVTTFNALGYLEKKPERPLPRFILPMDPGPSSPREEVSVTQEEKEPFRLQAAADLHSFYQARAEELASGGKLLVQVFGRKGEVSTSHGIYDVLSDAVLDAVEEGVIPASVYESLVFPIYFRSVEELIAPIKEDGELSTMFRIEKAEAVEVPVPFNMALVESGDVATWAESYMGFLRAFSEPILLPALAHESDGQEISNKIYKKVSERLVAELSRYPFRYSKLVIPTSKPGIH
jgi:hypothetical protein